jgi:2-polyprenyl-3-methyl-5-hydroxy-6-metoxy-1,4-benzoquinol methylase
MNYSTPSIAMNLDIYSLQMVDIGSGKGYLSSHLSLRHGLQVLGIDASKTNTDGATGRDLRLGKQWNGLVIRW